MAMLVPDEAADVPAMASERQRAYYAWLARTHPGRGAIVELGCWLGGVTVCLAAGVRARPVPTPGVRVHAYDAFEWHDWMVAAADDAELAARYGPGDSFYAEFARNCAPVADLVVAHRTGLAAPETFGRFPPMEWPGGAIDILVNDLWDDDDVTTAMWDTFAPALVPGRSVVVMHQFGLARSRGLRRFCGAHADELEPMGPPVGGAQAFRFGAPRRSGQSSKKCS